MSTGAVVVVEISRWSEGAYLVGLLVDDIDEQARTLGTSVLEQRGFGVKGRPHGAQLICIGRRGYGFSGQLVGSGRVLRKSNSTGLSGAMQRKESVMTERWMISSDSHVVELPDLFTSRIDREFADRAPRVVEEDGVDWWTIGSGVEVPAINPTRAGDRFDDPDTRRHRVKFDDEVRRGAYMPDEWIKDNESDGVWGGVLFPSMSLIFYGIEDSALLSAVCRTYTDWAIEFASAYPDRLKALAMINLDDIDAAVAELQRSRKRGASGALIPVAQSPERPYDSPIYEPFWAAAQDLDMPLNMHVATNRGADEWKLIYKFSEHASAPDYWVRVGIGDMIMSGVFERYPRLKVGSVEHEAGWAAFWLRRMDHLYTESIDLGAGTSSVKFRDGALPSDFFKRNVFICFTEDDVAIHNRHIIGTKNLLWGSDYPHGESTFPQSRRVVAEHLAMVAEDEFFQMTSGNVADLYHFDVPPGGPNP
jgi:predicted TIM-barrel fold metal-dependent hydrolase